MAAVTDWISLAVAEGLLGVSGSILRLVRRTGEEGTAAGLLGVDTLGGEVSESWDLDGLRTGEGQKAELECTGEDLEVVGEGDLDTAMGESVREAP